MNQINVIKLFTLITILFTSSLCVRASDELYELKQDTIYVLYEDVGQNEIKKSSRINPVENEYPKDWGRTYNIINKNVHVWFYYHNHLPEWSDMIFSYK